MKKFLLYKIEWFYSKPTYLLTSQIKIEEILKELSNVYMKEKEPHGDCIVTIDKVDLVISENLDIG